MIAGERYRRYYKGMKINIKSSITLPAKDVVLVEHLMKKLGIKSKVEVIRMGLMQLKNNLDRDALRTAYIKAAAQTAESTKAEMTELDHL